MSSSMVVKAVIKLLNSWKASGVKFRLTSSHIVRGMRMEWRSAFSSSRSRNSYAQFSFNGPKAKTYSFESMAKRDLFLPNGFSCFSQSIYDIFLVHLKYGRRILCDYFSNFNQMVFGFFWIFHCLHLNIKPTMKLILCQENRGQKAEDQFSGIRRAGIRGQGKEQGSRHKGSRQRAEYIFDFRLMIGKTVEP